MRSWSSFPKKSPPQDGTRCSPSSPSGAPAFRQREGRGGSPVPRDMAGKQTSTAFSGFRKPGSTVVDRGSVLRRIYAQICSAARPAPCPETRRQSDTLPHRDCTKACTEGGRMENKKVSDRIKAKRLAKKVTLAQVAKAVGKNSHVRCRGADREPSFDRRGGKEGGEAARA
jgi:hypothetical protein